MVDVLDYSLEVSSKSSHVITFTFGVNNFGKGIELPSYKLNSITAILRTRMALPFIKSRSLICNQAKEPDQFSTM